VEGKFILPPTKNVNIIKTSILPVHVLDFVFIFVESVSYDYFDIFFPCYSLCNIGFPNKKI
jgi:hypothetical protein